MSYLEFDESKFDSFAFNKGILKEIRVQLVTEGVSLSPFKEKLLILVS